MRLRVLFCGGRDYNDWAAVVREIHALPPDAIIVNGAARGADSLAWDAAVAMDHTIDVFPAEWDKYGKAAGAIRNQAMLDSGIDLVIAFPGGNGTRDMIRRARAAGVEVREIT
jgi:hypothetical protein